MKVSKYLRLHGLTELPAGYQVPIYAKGGRTGEFISHGELLKAGVEEATRVKAYREELATAAALKTTNGALKNHTGYYEVVPGVWVQSTPLTVEQLAKGKTAVEKATIGGVGVQVPSMVFVGSATNGKTDWSNILKWGVVGAVALAAITLFKK